MPHQTSVSFRSSSAPSAPTKRYQPPPKPLVSESRTTSVLAQLADRGLGDAGHAHRLHQVVDPAGRDAADPGFLDDRYQRLLHRPARLQKAGKVRSLAQLRDAQVERA